MVEWVCTLLPLDVIPVYCCYIKIYRRFISYNTSTLFDWDIPAEVAVGRLLGVVAWRYSPGGTLCDRGIPVEVAVGRLLGVVAW